MTTTRKRTATKPWKQSMADIYRGESYHSGEPHPLLELIEEIDRTQPRAGMQPVPGSHHSVHFPTFGICTACGHYRSAWAGGKEIGLEDRATLQRLLDIHYGYFLAKWEGMNMGNRFYVPELCNCDHEHVWAAYDGPDRQTGRCFSDIKCTVSGCGVRRVIDSSD
jgi:hypothetical protein